MIDGPSPPLRHEQPEWLADTWLMLAVQAKKLADMLADSWLLSKNSQLPHNALNQNWNSSAGIQHNSQQKNKSEKTARNSQLLARYSPSFATSPAISYTVA